MTSQELENHQRGEYLHSGLFLKDVPRMEQMIRDAVQRGVYLNPTMGYELGSQSSLARKHENLTYDLFRNGALMAYYPENLADGSLVKFRAIRNCAVRHENLVPLAKLSPDEIEAFSEAYRLEGVGFISDSIVRVDGVSVPRTFVNIRTLKAPATVRTRPSSPTRQ